MIYRDFKGEKLSMLGFGTMRLPMTEDGGIDVKQTEEMVDLALSSGVNYIDTAYPYMSSKSEIVIGRRLSKYPRDSFYLADKYPGHMLLEQDPEGIFAEQLKKCGVDYFDFYLLHNVYENDIDMYMDGKLGVLEYFKKMKEEGKIRHLGLSSHGDLPCLVKFLDWAGDAIEFVQIQLNYLDWTLQDAKGKYEELTKRGIPVWVMEPVRGGKLAVLSPEDRRKLDAAGMKDKETSYAFRWFHGLENVGMVLSGMSNMDQMKENIATFDTLAPLGEKETGMLLELAEGMKNSIPCTSCRYCCDGCPMGLDIPDLIYKLNQLTVRGGSGNSVAMQMDALPEDKLPSACIGCGRCRRVCPQKIDIPAAMEKLTEEIAKFPRWTDTIKERAEAARKAREEAGKA